MRRIKTWLLLALLTALVLLLTGCACKHEETVLVNVVIATCTEDGYTGDAQCTKCNEIVAEGAVVPAAGHTPGEPTGAVDPTCTEDGYTGDILCTVCGETVEQGETVPATGHTPGELTDAKEATCTEDGYTGDVPCAVCGEIVEQGEAIPAAGHTPGELANAAEATCTEDGYTGDVACAVCGEILEQGEVIPAGHVFVDGICEACGLRQAGLYVDDKLVAVWADLVADGTVHINVARSQLLGVNGDLQMGTLVIGDDITYISGISNNTIKEIWVPASVTRLGSFLLYGNTSVETVRLFCDESAASSLTFSGSDAAVISVE